MFNRSIKLLKECKVNLKWRKLKEHSQIEWDRALSMQVAEDIRILNLKSRSQCRISFR